MRKTIVRTMATSTIKGFIMKVVDGKPVVETLEPITVMGKVKEKEAIKALREKYGKTAPVTISAIEVNEETYEISVADFVKYAKKVTNDSQPSESDSEASETKAN